MSVSLTWVDAFTDRPFAGNPAGVCLLEEPLPVSTMQSLATELGIAETAFVTPTDVPGTFGLRWFSPRVEIDLCGHATLAVGPRPAGPRCDRRHDAGHLRHPERCAAGGVRG